MADPGGELYFRSVHRRKEAPCRDCYVGGVLSSLQRCVFLMLHSGGLDPGGALSLRALQAEVNHHMLHLAWITLITQAFLCPPDQAVEDFDLPIVRWGQAAQLR